MQIMTINFFGKIFILTVIFLGSFNLITLAAGAPPPAAAPCPGQSCPAGKICIPNPICAQSFEELINNIIDILFYLGVVIAPLMIIVAAYYFLAAGGDPKNIETARKIILWTVIGVSIIFVSKGFIELLRKYVFQ